MTYKLSSGKKLPIGTVTFFITDFESTTPHWERQIEKMASSLQIGNALFRQKRAAKGGHPGPEQV